ncbi:hypothetical protein B296_00003106 [Ensete ventricosum]|uniref:Uncharacterized protein n=1 Tax=Ensete ventricosum TaxID=4639 RepID=A0A427A608_ENSVE|nr:hypothetical protein B296_00003106 [Ensete ventricosum]
MGNFFSLRGEKKRLPAWGRKTGMSCAYHSISGTIPYRTELSMPVRTSMAILYSIYILLSPYCHPSELGRGQWLLERSRGKEKRSCQFSKVAEGDMVQA